MNKEEKLAYLDKLVEPQGNESGMSVAPLLREMIEDAGDQVEVDDAIEAAKEAKETAEAAEAAATAAGTAAQEANTAAGNAQTAADNAAAAAQKAQETADAALEAAQSSSQLSDEDPQPVSEEASAGNSTMASRADHVHQMIGGTMVTPKQLSNGTDLDNIKESGVYGLFGEGYAYEHFPPIPNPTQTKGILIVSSSGSFILQTLIAYMGSYSYMYVRRYDTRYFRGWKGGPLTVGQLGQGGAYSEIFNGERNTATGDNSHAEGNLTTASGECSHSEGCKTTASADYSHAEGSLNVSLDGATPEKKMIHMVGIGNLEASNPRAKNAHTIMKNGDHYVVGIGGYEGTENKEEAFDNIKSLQTVISELQTAVQTLQGQIATLQGTGA